MAWSKQHQTEKSAARENTDDDDDDDDLNFDDDDDDDNFNFDDDDDKKLRRIDDTQPVTYGGRDIKEVVGQMDLFSNSGKTERVLSGNRQQW